jgi:hypothetical protein
MLPERIGPRTHVGIRGSSQVEVAARGAGRGGRRGAQLEIKELPESFNWQLD